MKKFFRKIRQNLLMENKTGKYFKYAIGEIILVVIGILIALQINNWNELRKQKLVEINILEGIRTDILKDTIDLNFNISAYSRYIKSDSIVLNHLINKKDLNQNVVNTLIKSMEADWFIILHDSHFQEAKLKGLSIISDLNLRESISRLYEFDYKALILMENSSENFNHSKYVDKKLNQYFGFDSTGFIINKKLYNRLLSDDNILYNIKQGQLKKRRLLDIHISTLESALKVVKNIDEKLNKK
jgi:hypothetical protein